MPMSVTGATQWSAPSECKVPAETLELGRQQHGIGLVDLLCGRPHACARAAHRTVGAFDVVEGGGPFGKPLQYEID